MSEVKPEAVTTEAVEAEPKPKQTRQVSPVVIYPEVPTRIISIDGQYIKDYLKGEFEKGKITRKELGLWADKAETLIAEKGERKYFQEFRSAFVKAFFPELEQRKNQKAKKENMADFIKGLL